VSIATPRGIGRDTSPLEIIAGLPPIPRVELDVIIVRISGQDRARDDAAKLLKLFEPFCPTDSKLRILPQTEHDLTRKV